MAASTVTATHVALTVLLLVTLHLLYDAVLSPLRRIPGPYLGRLTNFYRSYLTRQGNVGEHFRQWHRKYGTAVRVGPNAVSISDPELIKVIYTTRNAWLKSDMYRPNDLIVDGQRIPNIFNTSDKAFHARYTAPIRGFWSMTKILDLEPFVDQTLSKLVSALDQRFVDKKGEVCMMDDWLGYFAWDAAANVSFNQHYGFLDEGKDVQGMIAESTAGLEYFAPVSQIPWLDEWLDKNPVWRIGPRPLVNGFVYTVKIIADYQQALAQGTADNTKASHFMAKYTALKDKVDIANDNQIINWLMLNVLAGGDSTSGALRSVAYHVAKNPRVNAKLVQELDANVTTVPAPWKEVKDLRYLSATILEAQRITPALGLMLERIVPAEGFTLPDGRFIPAGTKVGMNPYVVTRDVGVFGEDVADFRPERWLQRDGEDKAAFDARYRRMWDATDLMYGAGSRVCMGKNLVQVEMWKLFATLYKTFDIKLTNPNHEWNYFNAWFMYQTDMPMVISRREKA